ncbi:major facilitator superfamily domain-containing protein [Colletotrichum godetiae]|uniref:Major facilitator superfamily domain-containing protein n=1 Tax=Colletotrichum godetiae TaxID=1209918 RepID=A0AAJ0A709_9PEZI|nr:major facilitator superfamily domain-containing protein [Colletotrichum godetiae]KAK1657224.1 major facilitator superfamily domain-containing protein [Colletotrichum godetiae]
MPGTMTNKIGEKTQSKNPDSTDAAVGVVERGGDIAAHLVDQFANEPDYDRQEEVKLRWKIDLRLVPMLWLNITFPAMDKVTPSTGALYGMRDDLGLKGDQHAWDVLPLVTHVLLGALEAPVAPGNFIIMTMWYTRREQPVRVGLFYTGLSTIITGAIGWAVGISIAYGVVAGVLLPDNPVSVKLISDKERFVTVERLRGDQLGIEKKTFSRRQSGGTLVDPKTWLMFAFSVWISIPNRGLTMIVSVPGFSLLTGVLQTLSGYICNFEVFWCVRRFGKGVQVRGLVVVCGLVVGMVAIVLLYTLPVDDYSARLWALCWSHFYLGLYIVGLDMHSANTAGHNKKVTTNAIVFVTYCISNIIGPQFFKAAQAPLYLLGTGARPVSYATSIFTMGFYMLYCWSENRRRDRVDAARRGDRVHLDSDFRDLTDRENVHFRNLW